MITLLITLILLQVSDVWTTYEILAQGSHEDNPNNILDNLAINLEMNYNA